MQKIDAEMKLVIELKNKTPVELVDLTNSLACLAAEYNKHIIATQAKIEAKNIKLYVKEVRSGSVITELVALAPTLLPLYEYSQTVLSFAQHIKDWKEFLLGANSQPPSDTDKNTLQNISGILEPVAKDVGSELNIGALTINGGTVALNFNISSVDANAIQNRCNRLLEEIKEPIAGLHRQVALSLHQTRNEIGQNVSGDKAIIQTISDKPVRLAFEHESTKQYILDVDRMYHKAFIVDVIVETVQDKPVLYKVKHIHDAIDV